MKYNNINFFFRLEKHWNSNRVYKILRHISIEISTVGLLSCKSHTAKSKLTWSCPILSGACKNGIERGKLTVKLMFMFYEVMGTN